jgi:hypothetical protein
MSYIVTSSSVLNQIPAPRLPDATKEYDPRYVDQLNNILRLYFNRIDNLFAQLSANTPVTVATLPNAATAGVGSRAFVTDSSVSTFGTTVAGGGSTKVPVYSDGANWKVG